MGYIPPPPPPRIGKQSPTSVIGGMPDSWIRFINRLLGTRILTAQEKHEIERQRHRVEAWRAYWERGYKHPTSIAEQ